MKPKRDNVALGLRYFMLLCLLIMAVNCAVKWGRDAGALHLLTFGMGVCWATWDGKRGEE